MSISGSTAPPDTEPLEAPHAELLDLLGQPDSTEQVFDAKPNHRLELLLFLIVVAGRCAFSLRHSLFRLYPDEPGTLAMARWLSGNGDWDMGTSLTWKPGMATLIAPLFWLTDDQETILRGGLVIAAIAGGAAAVLMSRLATRLTELTPPAAIVVSGLLALSPSALASSAYVWGESLVALAFLGTLAAVLKFYDAPSTKGASVTILWASASYLSHSRMLPLLITVGVLTAGRLMLNGDRKRGLLAIALSVGAVVAVDAYSSLFYSALWVDPNDNNTVSEVASRLGQPLEIVFAATGQLWYLLVSSAGVFGLGACVLIVRSLKETDRRLVRDARLVIASMAPLIGLSVVFMSGRDRVDQQIYGRYNDAIIWPVVTLGVAWLLGSVGPSSWRTGRQRVILFGSIGLAIIESMMVTELVLQRRSVSDVVVAQMIPGIAGVLNNPDELNIIVISLLALATLTVIALSTSVTDHHRRWSLAVVALVVLALGVRTYRILEVGNEFALKSTSVRELVGTKLRDGDEVVFGFVPDELQPGVDLYLQGYYSQLYQWYLPEIDFRVIATGKYPVNGYAFAPVFDRVLMDRGACIVWRDPVVGIVLWDLGPDRCDSPA